ncbi:AI-2E family transporter [Leptolyngbya sp. 'hensonii']|uniref:AI-2E family transporter n=1 Tax=Leptolyngbya sp. 'hensonii' TaxID=1922337 RepID=UPI00094F65CB|nr:AI-2E family transporter [Leptolyngbya sp. 'hensonii']OLP17866.1 AI-2E family transporter [Leptolyngbya sp. 'hensonii']
MSLGQWIGLLAIISTFYILWEIRQVLLLIFAAVVLAIALNRLAYRFQRFGIKRSIAVVLSTLLLILVLIGIFLLIVPAFAHQFQELSYLLPKGIQVLNRQVDYMRTSVPTWAIPYLPDVEDVIKQVQPLANQLVQRSFSIFSNSLGALLNFLLVFVITLMFLAEPLAYRQGFIRLFPSFYRRRMDEVLGLIEIKLGKWVIGALLGMLIIGLLSWMGLTMLGVRAALANAIVAGLLNLIPNLGPTISVILPMSISLLDSAWKPLAVFGLYFAIQQFESNVLTPRIMAQQVHLLPAVTLMSQVFFASFFGFLGLFLAIPLTVVGQVMIQEILVKDVLDPWRSTRSIQETGADSPTLALADPTLVLAEAIPDPPADSSASSTASEPTP